MDIQGMYTACKSETTEEMSVVCADFQDEEGENEYEIESVEQNSSTYGCSTKEIKDFPLDLRTSKLPSLIEYPRPVIHKKNKNQVISIAELLENFYYDEMFVNHNAPKLIPSSDMSLDGFKGVNHVENPDYTAEDYSTHQKKYADTEMDYSDSARNTLEYWSVGTNTDLMTAVDSATQTQLAETVDASVQTDVMTYPVVKNVQKLDVKFTCSICQRFYASKSSYDRHFKTHLDISNNQEIISNVHITAEAKLQVYKKQGTKEHSNEPIIIKLPSTSRLQCESCKECFTTQKEKDEHFEDCIIEPFAMTKCSECSIKFYTLECLNKHVNLVHKKHSSANAYYCIFCNEHFDAAFTFQLHLDKHLSQ